MSSVLDSLRAQRKQTFTLLRAVVEPAAAANRELTPGEHADYTRLNDQLSGLDARIGELVDQGQRATDADGQLRQFTPTGPANLSAVDRQLDQQFRSAILERNPAPIEVRADPGRTFYQPGLERRDLLKTTATQALPVSVYNRVVAHLVESTAVLSAGATVVNTPGGESLQVPKSTAFSTAALTAEGAAITEADPTLAVVSLGAYKYAAFFQVSSELAADSQSDLLGFLAMQAAQSLSTAFGPHLTGTGTGQPRGIVTDALVGVTGPTGTATSFGAQGTAGQGTDLLIDLAASTAEPYSRSPAAGWLLRTPTLATIRKLKSTQGEPAGLDFVGPPPAGSGAQAAMLGYPAYVDPGVATMAANAKSVVWGDFSRYFVRIAGGMSFQRSDEFAFQNDLVSFRALIRLDGAMVDINALKVFVHSAT